MKYQIIRCICWKGESLGVSINNPRNQEDAGTFNTKEQAESYKDKLEQQEVSRIKGERKSERGWNGNEFVFWVQEVKG